MSKNDNISLFAVSFKQGFTSPNIPIATFYQGDKKLNLLLDSGSDKNVIDALALQQFQHEKIDNTEHVQTLSGVGGTQEVSMCTLSFGCEEEKYVAEFLVTDLRPAFDLIDKEHCIVLHGILGASFLRDNNIVLDFKNLSAYNR